MYCRLYYMIQSKIKSFFRGNLNNGNTRNSLISLPGCPKNFKRNSFHDINYPGNDTVKKILTELTECLGFTQNEAKAYLSLLQDSPVNGYRLSANSNIPRSMIYQVIKRLKAKGTIKEIPGETNLYQPIPPSQLLARIKNEFASSISILEISLGDIYEKPDPGGYFVISGIKNIRHEIVRMIRSATREILISTNLDLSFCVEELRKKERAGIQIVLFSFSKLGYGVGKEYSHGANPGTDLFKRVFKTNRLSITVDREEALTGDIEESSSAVALHSRYKTYVGIVGEHIRHDIYLLKLQNKFGKNIMDDIVIGPDREILTKL